MALTVIFDAPEELPKTRDATEYRFAFRVVDSDFVATPEELSRSTQHGLTVRVSGTLEAIWNLPKEALIRVLFEYARREIDHKLMTDSLADTEILVLDTENTPNEIPFDYSRIEDPTGAEIQFVRSPTRSGKIVTTAKRKRSKSALSDQKLTASVYESISPDSFTGSPSSEQLRRLLEQHSSWLRTSGSSGKKANLERSDLRHANLQGVDLREANLRWADLRGADLSGANLEGVDLFDANLKGAKLKETVLQWAVLQGADFDGADLTKARLREADLQGANLQAANLRSADLRACRLLFANLANADLREADLQSAELLGANLTSANFAFARLRKAYFKDTSLIDTEFQHTDLRGADLEATTLHGSELLGANLESANIRGADLSLADHLTQPQIESAFGDARTSIPDGLRRPSHWEDDAGGVLPPTVPEPAPGPIRTKIEANRIVLDESAETMSDSDQDDLSLHWKELKRDAHNLGPRLGNAPGLAHRVEDYEEALGQDPHRFNEILLGLRGEALIHAVARAEQELLGDTLGDLEGFVAKHQVFMRHFPRWLRHLAPEESVSITPESVQKSGSSLDRIFDDIAQDRELFDQRIPKILRSLKASASEPKEFARAAWLGVHRGLNDVLHSLAKFAIEFGKGVKDEALKQGSKRAAVFLVSLAGVGLMDLIGILPTDYGWLAPILVFLRRAADGDSIEDNGITKND